MRSFRVLSVFACLSIGAVAVVSCSSSSSGGGGPSGDVTSIDGSKEVSGLSDADVAQYCKDFIAYERSALSQQQAQTITCLLQGVLSAAFVPADQQKTTCENAFDQCMSHAVPPNTKDPCADGTFAAGAKTCNATVAEVDACLKEQLQAEVSLANEGKSACSSLSFDGGTDAGTGGACASAQAKCPGLLGGSSSPSDGGFDTAVPDAGGSE